MPKATQVVPAEVISVADRLVGNLSLAQAAFLGAPIGLAAFLLLAPPKLAVVPYKVGLVLLLAAICLPLAWRCQGRLLASWLVIGQQFYARPKAWVLRPARGGSTKGEGL